MVAVWVFLLGVSALQTQQEECENPGGPEAPAVEAGTPGASTSGSTSRGDSKSDPAFLTPSWRALVERLLTPAIGKTVADMLVALIGDAQQAKDVAPILERMAHDGVTGESLHDLGHALECGPHHLVIAQIGRKLLALGVDQTDVDALEKHFENYSWSDMKRVGGKSLALLHALKDAATFHTTKADLLVAIQLVKDIRAFCSPNDIHCGAILMSVEQGLAKKILHPLRRLKSWTRRHPRTALGIVAGVGTGLAAARYLPRHA